MPPVADVALDRERFRPYAEGELMVYYRLARDAEARVRVLSPDERVFAVLTKGPHSAGLNSVAWDGRGLTGQLPVDGTYRIDVTLDGETHRRSVEVENDFRGRRNP